MAAVERLVEAESDIGVKTGLGGELEAPPGEGDMSVRVVEADHCLDTYDVSALPNECRPKCSFAGSGALLLWALLLNLVLTRFT